MHTQLSAAIKDSFKGFKKPQPTQTVYWEALPYLHDLFPDFDHWKLRLYLLIEISEGGLAENQEEICSLFDQVMKKNHERGDERVHYELWPSID